MDPLPKLQLGPIKIYFVGPGPLKISLGPIPEHMIRENRHEYGAEIVRCIHIVKQCYFGYSCSMQRLAIQTGSIGTITVFTVSRLIPAFTTKLKIIELY